MIVKFITARPGWTLLFTLLISIPLWVFVPQVKTINDVDYTSVENDPDIEFYDGFKGIFEKNDFFMIVFRNDNIFQPAVLKLIHKLTIQLEKLEEVREVTSLSNVNDIIGEADAFRVEKFLKTIPSDRATLARLKKRALNNPLYRDRLISRDGTTTTIIVYPYDPPEAEDDPHRLIDKTFAILKNFQESTGQTFHVAGLTLTNVRLNEFLQADTALFIPLSYFMIIVMVWLFFRSLKIAVMAFLNISLCLAGTFGFMAIVGATINDVTSLVPPLIMALSLANSIHIFNHYLRHRRARSDNRAAIQQTWRGNFKPCFFATLTTSVGFLSLTLSRINSIQEFGLSVAAGVWLAFIFSFLFLPALMIFMPLAVSHSTRQVKRDRVIKLLAGIVQLNRHYHRVILLLFIGLSLGAGYFISRINVETNFIEWFKSGTSLRQSLDFVENHLAGVESIDVSLQGERFDLFKDPENVEFIETVQNYLNLLPEIDMTMSFADYIKDMNESFHNEDPKYRKIPDSRKLIAQYLLLYDAEDIEDVMNEGFNHARIMARTSEHSSRIHKQIIQKIEIFLAEKSPLGLTARVTGAPVSYLKTIDELLNSQIKSLATTVIVISCLMFVVFRSWRLGLISLIPNLFPVVLNFGIMGLFGIPLNTGTALIAAVVIGIIVDDTIHFLHHYQAKLREGCSPDQAIANAIQVKGVAVLTTSLVLFFGFGVELFASFIPLIQFGLLCAIIMLSALAADLFLLPSILSLAKATDRKVGSENL
ncbi:RND family transporter [bacterium]|nr:RND family transporter [bacterium]